MPSLNLRDFSDLSTDQTTLCTFNNTQFNATGINNIEKQILIGLIHERPDDLDLGEDIFKQDISDDIYADVMVTNNSNEPNSIVSLEFIEDTDVISSNNNASLIYHNNLNGTLLPEVLSNNMSLGPDTSALYVGNLFFDFIDGDSNYTSDAPDSHRIQLDAHDPDYNYFKAFNSPLSNLSNTAASNGITGGFDNNFNVENAFYTENTINRDTISNQLIPFRHLSGDGISSSIGNSEFPNYNALTFSLAPPSFTLPVFGAFKTVQEPLVVDIETNVTNNSSMAIEIAFADYLNLSPITTSSLPTTIDEPDFKSLFTSDKLAKVGPGYNFNVSVDVGGGYDINNNNNKCNSVVYDATNTAITNAPLDMFELDDRNIHKNLRYMKEITKNSYLDEHRFNVKNGNFLKDGSMQSNKNFNDFVVRDGTESLQVMTIGGISDLTTNGVITVINTNNTLGDTNARYIKNSVTQGTVNINRLLVSYEETESDYLEDVGSLSETLENMYHVESTVTVLAQSTLTSDSDLWTTSKTIAKNNDAVLAFQDTPNSLLYIKSNIYDFEAVGLNTLTGSDDFTLISINKYFDIYNSSDESPLFQTANKNAMLGVNSSVRLSNIDLNAFSADDLRVTLIGKKKEDMPVITSDSDQYQWNWFTGDESGLNYNEITGEFVDGNDSYLISSKNSKNLLGPDIYKIMNKTSPSTVLTLQINFSTNPTAVENRDILERKAEIKLEIYNATQIKTFAKTIQVDEGDLVFKDINETTSEGQDQVLDTITGFGFDGDKSRYTVKKYVTSKEYFACIKVRIGAYKNLWAVRRVAEETTWYQLFDIKQNKILPDFYLKQLKKANASPAFPTIRRFINSDEIPTSKLSCTTDFLVKHLMGFKVGLEYKHHNTWTPFVLATDTEYDNSIDTMFDLKTDINLLDPDNVSCGSATITIDTPLSVSLGLSRHLLITSNPNKNMYMINLSNSSGNTTFTAVGYKYNIATDSVAFNKNNTWSPFAVGDELFLQYPLLRTGVPEFAGNPLILTTRVDLIDPTPQDTSNVNEVNHIKLTIMHDNNEIASFSSNKWILENFNIIMNRAPIIQHDYIVSRTRTQEDTPLIEYLHAKNYDQTTSGTFYAKLLFGNNYNGVRAELSRKSIRGTTASFALKGDRVYMTPLLNAVDNVNSYSGKYSNINGTEILPSTLGYPLPTNSTVHRNMHPTKFRGYKNGESSINILRTDTRIKMVIGTGGLNQPTREIFQDDMNPSGVSNVADVWTNRGVGAYTTLESRDIRKVNNNDEVNNMEIFSGNPIGSARIGSLGLKITPYYSMFSTSISSTLHYIPIGVTPANYQKVITNPLDQSMNETTYSNVFDVVLHDFSAYDIVATRFKVYQGENYEFKYNIPDLKVYHSPQYVGDVKTFDDWSVPVSYSDALLRNGVAFFGGVINFKRDLTFVSSHTKYGILPRPIAFLEAYDIPNSTRSETMSLPADLSYLSRRKYYVDINIGDVTSVGVIGASDQSHYPFSKDTVQNIPNQVNPVIDSVGLNNVKLGFGVGNYLSFRENKASFSFTLTSNKVKIYNGIGLSAVSPSNREMVFDGYISQLADKALWPEEYRIGIINTFTENKKWNLSFPQLQNVLFSFINPTNPLPPLTNNYLFINGITPFSLGEYYLDLKVSDSVVASYYSIDRSFDSGTNQVLVNFYKQTSVAGINWATNDQFIKCENFRPLIVKIEKFTHGITIPNVLTEIPFNIDTLIKASVSELFTNSNTNSNTNIVWVDQEPPIGGLSAPVRITPLSIKGSKFLHSIIQVNKDFPFKLLGFNRPSMILVKSADGSVVAKLTPDGTLMTNNLVTNRIGLETPPTLQMTTPTNLGIEHFIGNINARAAYT